jgi:hypothetical protein
MKGQLVITVQKYLSVAVRWLAKRAVRQLADA